MERGATSVQVCVDGRADVSEFLRQIGTSHEVRRISNMVEDREA